MSQIIEIKYLTKNNKGFSVMDLDAPLIKKNPILIAKTIKEELIIKIGKGKQKKYKIIFQKKDNSNKKVETLLEKEENTLKVLRERISMFLVHRGFKEKAESLDTELNKELNLEEKYAIREGNYVYVYFGNDWYDRLQSYLDAYDASIEDESIIPEADANEELSIEEFTDKYKMKGEYVIDIENATDKVNPTIIESQ